MIDNVAFVIIKKCYIKMIAASYKLVKDSNPFRPDSSLLESAAFIFRRYE